MTATKKKTSCSVTNCFKNAQHGKDGMCKRHFTEAKLEAGIDPVGKIIEHVEKAASVQVKEQLETTEVSTPDGFGMVTNGNGDKVPFGVDGVVLAALIDAWEAKKHDWLVELSGLKPGKAICFAAQMIKAVEMLGY